MIKKVEIKGMNGYRDIDISFNNNISFLVGINGSGKTTVLNIISSILLGKFEILNDFIFDYTVINLIDLKGKNVKVKVSKAGDSAYEVEWNGKRVTFNTHELKLSITRRRNGRLENNNPYQESVKDYCTDISQVISFGFLPLSRDIKAFNFQNLSSDNEGEYFFDTDGLFHQVDSRNNRNFVGKLDDSLNNVNKIVRENQRKIMLKFDEINDKMRNEMFECMLEHQIDEIEDLNEIDLDVIKNLKNALEDLGISIPGFESFRTRFLEDVDSFLNEENSTLINNGRAKKNKNKKASGKLGINVHQRILITFYQLNKIKKLWEIVNKYNIEKSNVKSQFENFFKVINQFFKDSNKELFYSDESGELLFKTQIKDKPSSLDSLSSGEKQLVIFFAFLLLSSSEKSKNTFIIDEPEISLHPAWQRKFTKSLLEVTENIQFIFATHSPEIIGSFRDKAIVMGRDI